MIIQIGHISHPLRSFLGAIELNILRAFIRMQKMIVLLLKLGRLYCTNMEFNLLATLEKCNQLSTRNKIIEQLANFLIISSIYLYKIFYKFQGSLSSQINLFP